MKNNVFEENRLARNVYDPSASVFVAEYADSAIPYDESSPFHYHGWYELYYLRDGVCTYRVDKKSYVLNKGDWIIISPKSYHKVFYDMESHARILLYFSKDYISPVVLPHLKKYINNPVYSPEPEEATVIDDIVSQLVAEYNNPDEFSDTMYKNLLYMLLVRFIRRSSFAIIEKDTDLVTAHIIDFIEHNYASKITLDELADISNLSPNYLSQRFKSVTGVGITEYVRKVRVRHAKVLLLETKESILQISEKCGFGDSNYFSTVFKAEESMSPLQYRKMYSS